MRRIYMDNAGTTPLNPEVFEAMKPWFTQQFGNPSSIHSFGQESRRAVEEGRKKVAALINARPEEIIFTGCGTEADNLAVQGTALANESKGRHIITSAIEHHAVLDTCAHMKRRGWDVTILPVDRYGLVDPEDVRRAIRPDTVLITVMHANNEIGTIEPIEEISKIAHEAGVTMHTDAVQTAGALPLDVDLLGVNMLSMSAHKIYGPKGIGALYVRAGTRISPLIHGGGQERRRRSGTENVPGIVGFGKAAELTREQLESRGAHLLPLRDRLIERLPALIPDTIVNGHPTKRLPNNVNVCIKYVEGESMLLALDMQGVAASSGSACTSGSLEPSHVLIATGIPHEIAHGSLRFSLGADNTEEDIEYLLNVLPPIVKRFRDMSPVMPGK